MGIACISVGHGLSMGCAVAGCVWVSDGLGLGFACSMLDTCSSGHDLVCAWLGLCGLGIG
jgi:hypothetical protein